MENPVEFIAALGDVAEAKARTAKDGEIKGAAERRAQIHMMGGIKRLISMLDGSNLTGGACLTQARRHLPSSHLPSSHLPSGRRRAAAGCATRLVASGGTAVQPVSIGA